MRKDCWGSRPPLGLSVPLNPLGAVLLLRYTIWTISDPYPIRLAASYLLETPFPLKLITKYTPYPHLVILT